MKSLLRVFRSSSSSKFAEASPTQAAFEIPHSTSDTMSSNNHSAPPKRLAVVELFQSQGCNSCPPANSNLINLSCPSLNQPILSLPTDPDTEFLLLTYHVTYWDYLGWRDTFAKSQFDVRQREYVRAMGLRSAFTPQVIVNGRSSGVGSSSKDLERVLVQGQAGEKNSLSVEVTVVKDENLDGVGERIVSVDASRVGQTLKTRLDVLLVRYSPEKQNVKIRSGENRGETLPHLNIVKSVTKIGEAVAGHEGVVVLSDPSQALQDGSAGVILVQDGPGGRVLGAARID